MASAKREQEYDANRRHYKEIQSGFKFGFWSTVIPAGAVLIGLAAYYFIRGLAILAGATMVIGQYYANQIAGTNDRAGLGYTVDYGLMAYIFAVILLDVLAFFLKKRAFNKLLIPLFIAGAVYGISGMFMGHCTVGKGLFLFALGCYGIWMEFYILRLHKELDVLSLKEGYPDFIVALNEPKTMANTSGLTYKGSEFKKRQRKEEGYEKMPNNAAMDELTLDTELPKGNRKIDNMM